MWLMLRTNQNIEWLEFPNSTHIAILPLDRADESSPIIRQIYCFLEGW